MSDDVLQIFTLAQWLEEITRAKVEGDLKAVGKRIGEESSANHRTLEVIREAYKTRLDQIREG